MNIKRFIKRLWNFYWNDNSLTSYIFFIITTIILLKFVIYPAFLYIFGLSDVVAIMSGSMEHVGNEDKYFYQYFEDMNYTKEEIDNFPYSKGLYIGDVIFAKKQNNYSVGDVIVFRSNYFPDKLVHRVVKTDPIETKGDNNPQSYIFDRNIDEVIGKVVFRIPYLGLPRYLIYRVFGI